MIVLLGDFLPSDSTEIFWQVLKFVYIFIIGVFFLFAVMMVRQTQLMSQTIISGISQKTRFVGVFFMILVIVVFIFSIIVL